MMNIPTPWTAAGQATIARRTFLRGTGAASALAAVPSFLWGTNAPDLVLILMADLHSGYAYTPALLQAVRNVVSNSPTSQVVIVVNGDVFESGNFLSALADPSNPGAIDLAMLRAFANLAPTIVTIGNHDGDLFDPADFVTKLQAIGGITLLSDLGDTRRANALYTPSAITTFNATRGNVVKVTSIGTPSNSYANNALYYRPDPGTYSAATFPGFYTAADFHLALVHAGFVQDTRVLPNLSGPFLLHGGHDHLRFTQPLLGGQGLHLHAGYWSFGLATVGINFGSSGVTMRPRQIQLTRTSPADSALAAQVAAARAAYLTPANNPVVGMSSAEYDLDTAVLKATDLLRQAADADIGFLSHTTFGQGLPRGTVSRLDLNSFVRFPGGFKSADISGAMLLSQVLPISNQFGNFPYSQRTGDYLYTGTAAAEIDPSKTYRCVVNSFAANVGFFGTPLPAFSTLGAAPGYMSSDPALTGLELRTLMANAIAAGAY